MDISIEINDLDNQVEYLLHENLITEELITDEFLVLTYDYYKEKGYIPIMTNRILNFILMIFILLLSTVLLCYTNWSEIINCHRIGNCHEISIYKETPWYENSISNSFLIGYFILGIIFIILNFYLYIKEICNFYNIRNFYKTLKIDEKELSILPWTVVSNKIINYIKQTNPNFNIDILVSRIMRRDNYLIAMINNKIIPDKMYIFNYEIPIIFSKIFENNIRFVILNNMFTNKNYTRTTFLVSKSGLTFNFIFIGFLNLILSPFIVVSTLMFSFLKYTQEFHKNPNSISKREWTPYSLWKIREYNELTHFFKERVEYSHTYADKYIAQFPNIIESLISKFIVFVVGSFLAILICISLIDERLLLSITIFKRNLLWYIAIFSILISIFKTFVENMNTTRDINHKLNNLIDIIHYYPKNWKDNIYSYNTFLEIKNMYRYKFIIFIQEVLSVLMTPYILIFIMPYHIERIISFVNENTIIVDNIGDICSFSILDLNIEQLTESKVKNSILTFYNNHPNWKPKNNIRDFVTSELDKSNEYLKMKPTEESIIIRSILND